nr:TNF receptor-associated factor 4-like isoform X2 [Styela clava]
MNLTTHCSNYSVGCKWTGKLHNLKNHIVKCSHSEIDCPNRCGVRLRASKLADHLEYVCVKRRVTCEFCSKDFSGEQLEDHEGNCPMESVHCENKCGAKMLRKYLARHSTGDCPKRPTKCPHCDKDFNFDILKTHFGNCPRYPISCPNRCDVLKIPREELEIHMKEHCKAAVTACPYKEVGCKHKCPRYHLDRHLTENQNVHMRTMFELVRTQKRQIETLQKQVSDLTVSHNGVLLWRIPEYTKSLQQAQKDQAEAELISPPFYTHRHGYKLQLSAFLNGNGGGHGSHLSLYVRVLNGEYDSLLEWPFSHDITFTILDQGDPLSSKRSHINVTFTPDPNWKNFQDPEIRRKDSDVDGSNLGFGYPKFVTHKDLKDNNYIKNNTLFIKATIDTSRVVIQ